MVRRLSPVLLALLVTGLIPPAAVAEEEDAPAPAEDETTEAEPDASDDDLEDSLDELSEAEAELATALERLERAEAQLDAIDRRIGSAAGELARIEARLEEAQAAYELAEQRVHEAWVAIEDAEARLELAVALETEAMKRLEDRAAEVYKHGTTRPHFLIQGVASADDWHQVAVTLRTFDRVLVNDRDLLDDAITARALADSARTRAELARVAAEEAEEAAAAELVEVEALHERQRAVVATAQQERRRQRAIYTALEEDAEVMQALKEKLEAQIAAVRGGPAPTPEPAAPAADGVPAWAGRLPAIGHAWAAAIAAAAHANGLDGRLMAALVWTESAFNPNAVSPAGAIGLAQLMPGTASWLGVDPWNPKANLDGGSRYLRMQLDRFGRIELALAAYNAGPGAVSRYGGIPPFAETQLYVVRVLERYQRISG